MTQTDQATKARHEDRLDEARVAEYLSENIPSLYQGQALEILQFPGGASNLTYLLNFADKSIVLRKPPPGTKARGAHDMGREFRVLEGLSGHYQYSPEVLSYCHDPEILGSPFYLMQRVDGLIPRREMPIKIAPEQSAALCENMMQAHLALHTTPVAATGLASLGKGSGYAERQILGWNHRYTKALTDDAPDAGPLMAWLEENIPADSRQSCIIHNDFKLDNLVLDAKDPTRIVGVLDWEMATIGDPLMDLGCSMAYWVDADDPQDLQMIRMLPTNIPGMMTRAQLVDWYAAEAEIEIADFSFYYVYGLFRLAVIAQQIYYRFKMGQTSNPKFAKLKPAVHVLVNTALRIIKQQ